MQPQQADSLAEDVLADGQINVPNLLHKLQEQTCNVKEITKACKMLHAALVDCDGLWTNSCTSTEESVRLTRIWTANLRLHVREREIQESLCGLLQSLWATLEKDEPNSGTEHVLCFLEEDGLKALMRSMEHHMDSADVLHSGCCLIRSCALKPVQHVPQSTWRDAVKAVVACIDNSSILQSCQKLGGLLALQQLSERVEGSAMQGLIVDAVSACLRQHADNSTLQMVAMGLLLYLLGIWPTQTEKLWKNDVLMLALCVIKEQLGDQDGHEAGCPCWANIEESIVIACRLVGIMFKHASKPHEHDCVGSVITSAMPRLMHNAEFQEIAILALLKAVENNKNNCDHMGKSGVLAVLNTMARYCDQLSLVSCAFRILFAVAERRPKWVADMDFLQKLLEQMDMHMQSATWAGSACHLMAVMVEDDITKHVTGLNENMIEAGCVSMIVKAMSVHTEPEEECDLLPTGCAVLSHIARVRAHTDARLRSRIVKEKGADAIIRAMALRANSIEIQKGGLQGLLNVVRRHADNCAAIGTQVIPAAVRAMLICNTIETHSIGSAALYFVLESEIVCRRTYQDLIGDCGGIIALKQTARFCEETRSIKSEFWASIVQSTIGALGFACHAHERNRDLCAEEGIISILMRILASPGVENDSYLQPAACCSLCFIIHGHKDNTETFLKHDGAKYLVRVKKMHYVNGAAVVAGMYRQLVDDDPSIQVLCFLACVCMYMYHGVYAHKYGSWFL
jgi:hypothetical protein